LSLQMKFSKSKRWCCRAAAALCILATGAVTAFAEHASPGPYEILPFDDAYIVEAFTDLLQGSDDIADWTGWTSNTWDTPHAYNDHAATDFSMGTGTPLRAITTGTVIALRTNVQENSHPKDGAPYYGNCVKIKADGKSPRGEDIAVITAHMLPTVQVSVGQRVNVGQLIGYSDNTGNSTSEHCHVESNINPIASTAQQSSSTIRCAFYNAHYKYPIMLSPTAKMRVGNVLRVRNNNTPIRADKYESSTQIGTAQKDQLYFASFPKRGYYRVFIPNSTSYRSGWIRAVDCDDVLLGTVIQPLPDPGDYIHANMLNTRYPMYETASASSNVVGYVNWAGGRFVAVEQAPGDWYKIALPGTGAKWGWVKADANMVVYPELINPTIDLSGADNDQFPMIQNFTHTGPLDYGKPKFDRRNVVSFYPTSPGGDGFALKLSDDGNSGDGENETIRYGRPEYRNYYVQCDVYLDYRPSYLGANGYETYGVFIRDDCFGGWDFYFEGPGNCYAMVYNSKTGELRCGKYVNGSLVTFGSPQTITVDGWNKMRIETQGTTIRYYLNGSLKTTATDTDFISGPCGLGYRSSNRSYPPGRGAYFDNFRADLLPGSSVTD